MKYKFSKNNKKLMMINESLMTTIDEIITLILEDSLIGYNSSLRCFNLVLLG
jgi:hypothetical protein